MDIKSQNKERYNAELKVLAERVKSVYQIIDALLKKTDSYKLSRTRLAIETLSSKFGMNPDGEIIRSTSENLSLLYKFKTELICRMVDLIDEITELIEENSNLEYLKLGIKLENIFHEMGYKILKFPVGSVYDLTLDSNFTTIENSARLGSLKSKPAPMYVSKSSYACYQELSGGDVKVIKKGKVELSDGKDMIGINRSK